MHLHQLENLIKNTETENEACEVLLTFGEDPEQIMLGVNRRKSEASRQLDRISQLHMKIHEDDADMQAELSKAQEMFETELSRSEEILRFFAKTVDRLTQWEKRPMNKAAYRRLVRKIEQA